MKKILLLFFTFIAFLSYSQVKKKVIKNTTKPIDKTQIALNNSLKEGLIAYYSFDGNADDQSSNDNNCIVAGATLTTDKFEKDNKAFYFNGKNNQILVGNKPIFDLTNTMTISVWILPNTLSGDIKVLSKFQVGSNSYQLSLLNGAASFQIIRGGSLSWDKCESDILQINQWQHIVCTYNNSEMKVYVNGVLKNKLAINGAINISTAPLIIGNYNGGNSWFNGKIDEVRLYNRAITEEEVVKFYNFNGLNKLATNTPKKSTTIVPNQLQKNKVSVTVKAKSKPEPAKVYDKYKDGIWNYSLEKYEEINGDDYIKKSFSIIAFVSGEKIETKERFSILEFLFYPYDTNVGGFNDNVSFSEYSVEEGKLKRYIDDEVKNLLYKRYGALNFNF